jgi:hypothetical protein
MNRIIEKSHETDVALQKLADADNPGYQVEVDPDEAERLGAFIEDAITEEDALAGSMDLLGTYTDEANLNQHMNWRPI